MRATALLFITCVAPGNRSVEVSPMNRLPLIFEINELVEGCGFFARVHITGRGLCAQDGERYTFFGVSPGGVAGVGNDVGLAHGDFRQHLRAVLFDIAEECSSFEGFKAEVEAFVADENEPMLAAWLLATEAARAGKLDSDLRPMDSRGFKPNVKVWRVEQAKPTHNELDQGTRLAVDMRKAS